MNWAFDAEAAAIDEAAWQARGAGGARRAAHRGYRALAGIYAGLRKWTELDAALVDSENAVPDNLMPFFRAASTIVVAGTDYPRAERYLRKYRAQAPAAGAPVPAFAHWRLGQVLEKEGKRAEAISELELSAKLKPDFEDGKKDLARVRASR